MWRYYLDLTKFSLAFSLIMGLLFGAFSGVLSFGLFGTPIGLIGYNLFHKNEYYSYFNLGYSKQRLILTTWIINLIVMFPIGLLVWLLKVLLTKLFMHA